MNAYLDDAAIFLRATAAGIQEELTESAAIVCGATFALGIERVLKGILYGVNPTYILSVPDFKHSLAVLYPERIVDLSKSHDVLVKSPTKDVIAFRESLLRASVVSPTTSKHKGLLFALSSIRDVIVHIDLRELDRKKLRELLYRDFYPLVLAYTQELGISRGKYLGEFDVRLSEIARQHQVDIENIVVLRIDAHRQRWKQLQNVGGYHEHQQVITNEVLETAFRYPITCPACDNTAVIYTNPEYKVDPATNTRTLVGEFVEELRCFFCKLHVTEFAEIDHLKLQDQIKASPEDDIPF